jgi:hypothetical protein
MLGEVKTFLEALHTRYGDRLLRKPSIAITGGVIQVNMPFRNGDALGDKGGFQYSNEEHDYSGEDLLRVTSAFIDHNTACSELADVLKHFGIEKRLDLPGLKGADYFIFTEKVYPDDPSGETESVKQTPILFGLWQKIAGSTLPFLCDIYDITEMFDSEYRQITHISMFENSVHVTLRKEPTEEPTLIFLS